MKVLVVGGGGREHALVWKLAQSPQVTQLWVAPGNGGTAGERLVSNSKLVENVQIAAEDLAGLVGFAHEMHPDLTVVGPDNPLGMGIVDLFLGKRLPIWGPNRQAARFESSKAFAQQFMERHGIPTARAGTFDDPKAALAFTESLQGRCAVKADGLALGKGVLICTDLSQARDAVDEILVRRTFGEAGRRVVIQELLEGTETSLHALCDGKVAKLFPSSQDHKRIFDNDEGPNTGGMGAVCPAASLNETELKAAAERVMGPWLAGCRAEKIDFRGIIYPGLMLTRAGPKVLEFNARFGDPETQVYLMRLQSDLFELLSASAEGTLADAQLKWDPRPAACVVMAAGGYPGTYRKGEPIHGLEEANAVGDVKVFHAGTRRTEAGFVTNGGRVLGVTALGQDLEAARSAAYLAAEKIRFDGAHYRRDIGGRALRASRMAESIGKT